MADNLLLMILGRLDEAQSRWYVAREAIALGRGGILAMQRLTGMSKPTILRGIRELTEGDLPEPGRVRRPGGGRARSEEHDPGLTKALSRLMDRSTAGDPMSPLRWTHKSTRSIAEELREQGHAVSYATVRRRLHELGYSLQHRFSRDTNRGRRGVDAGRSRRGYGSSERPLLPAVVREVRWGQS